MRFTHKFSAAVVGLIMAGAAIVTPVAAQADRNGSKTAALALGAASIALLATQRDKTPGIIAGVGALIAYNQSSRSRDCDRDQYNYDYRYNDRYNYRSDYYSNDRYNYRDDHRDRDRYDHDRYDRNRNDRDRHDRDHERDDHRGGDHHSRR